MLSNSEEIIFLEAIDQNFESDSEIETKNDEPNENLEKMSAKICDKLEEEENFSTENDSYELSNKNKININKKYLLMKDCININKSNINKLMVNIYKKYQSQVKFSNKIKAI